MNVVIFSEKRPLLMKIQKGQKIFISSTAYDLIDVRAELLLSLSQWGFEALGHEIPGFPIPLGMHSHDVCLAAVKQCDIFLLIIGGRYGNTYAGNNHPQYRDNNWSITRCEANLAYNEGKGFLTYVRDKVWNERKSYNDFVKSGKPSEDFTCSYVNNPAIFEFINEVNRRIHDNWIQVFNNSVQLKDHLRGRLTGETIDIFRLNYFGIYDSES